MSALTCCMSYHVETDASALIVLLAHSTADLAVGFYISQTSSSEGTTVALGMLYGEMRAPLSPLSYDGQWQHVCVVWENTAGSWKIFQNGAIIGQGTYPDSQGYVIPANIPTFVGQWGEYLYVGKISDANIWDHVLPDDEITRMTQECHSAAEEGNVVK